MKNPENLIVLDIETIPDIECSYSLFGLDREKTYSDIELRQKMIDYHLEITDGKNDFLRQLFHKVICISYLECKIQYLENGRETYDLVEINSMSSFSSTEEELIEKFWNYLKEKKPRIITFNGKMFDMPVLKYRAMKYGINCSWLFDGGKWDSYASKYSDKNLDLIDILSDYGSSAKVKMSEICSLFDIPCKLGINGSQVTEFFDAKKFHEIREYCETDVLATYLIYLRFALFSGKLMKNNYKFCIEKIEDFLIKSEKKSMKNFLNEWSKFRRI